MSKKIMAFAIFAYLTAMARAADVTLVYGRLTQVNNIVSQLLTIRNNGSPIKFLAIDCGFLQGDLLLATAQGLAHSIEAGQQIYMSVDALVQKPDRAERAECRISDIDR